MNEFGYLDYKISDIPSVNSEHKIDDESIEKEDEMNEDDNVDSKTEGKKSILANSLICINEKENTNCESKFKRIDAVHEQDLSNVTYL